MGDLFRCWSFLNYLSVISGLYSAPYDLCDPLIPNLSSYVKLFPVTLLVTEFLYAFVLLWFELRVLLLPPLTGGELYSPISACLTLLLRNLVGFVWADKNGFTSFFPDLYYPFLGFDTFYDLGFEPKLSNVIPSFFTLVISGDLYSNCFPTFIL